MTRASCPECGYDLNVGHLGEGDQKMTTCDNCTSELLVSIQEGEIKTRNTMDYGYSGYEYSQSESKESEEPDY